MKTTQKKYYTEKHVKNQFTYDWRSLQSWLHIPVIFILVGVPFHAFFTVWAAHLFGNYTIWRLWSSILLAGALIGSLTWLARNRSFRNWVGSNRLIIGILLYSVFVLLVAFRAWLEQSVTSLAVWYGLLSLLRYTTFFVIVYALARYRSWLAAHWKTLVFWPATIVALFALLQFLVLPDRFLELFGYGPATIPAVSTINNNPEYLRAFSTLRGPNPLGAYMLVILGLLGALWVRRAHTWKLYAMTAASLLAALFSFSRSAWLGIAVTALVLVVVLFQEKRYVRQVAFLMAAGFIGSILAFVVFRTNPTVQNALYHTEDESTVALSSNDQRESALKTGMREVISEPLGRGPGSAGPASIYNEGHEVRLAENYYLQVGQEIGWLGVVVFVGIQWLLFLKLWMGRQNPLALGIFAAGIGLVLVNLLSHAWADDTLAYLWWGLAGLALGANEYSRSKRKRDA